MKKQEPQFYRIGNEFKRIAGQVKSGRFTPPKATVTAGLLLTLVSLPILFFMTKSDKAESELTPEAPIGGIGHISPEVNTGDVPPDKDEAAKDALLAEEAPAKPTKKGREKAVVTIEKVPYTVKPGDTLSVIAKKFDVSPESIAGSSKLTVPDEIHVGQKLMIPTKDGFFYTVKKGERLAEILNSYNVKYNEFIKANPSINPDILAASVEIFLPGAKPKNLETAWLRPVASRLVTSPYGWRTRPRHAFHKGLDLKAPYVPVRSVKLGLVTYSGWLGGYGNVVVIQHDGGYKSLYAHLSRRYVKKGQTVARGKVIGQSGNTGYSFGPHLHLEITKNGQNINPAKLFKGLYHR